MEVKGKKGSNSNIESLGLQTTSTQNWNLSPEELVEETISKDMGSLASNGALVIKTGEFTGRSPKDRFIVKDAITESTVDWNDINLSFDSDKFYSLKKKLCNYLSDKEVYVRDAIACANEKYQLKIRVVTEYPWSNMFAYNMFIRPTDEQIENFDPEWSVLCAPGFMAEAEVDGTRQHNFAIVNFTEKQIIIGGTGYTGEIKKGIFSVLNYILPQNRNVLSMHCSSNIGNNGDTALFFGLSGTGKTTLSADPNRNLIGDDEHGWPEEGVFNFEGGCYAKVIDLSAETEPDIYGAIKHGAILENIAFKPGSNDPDYEDSSITQNTRVSYPIHYIHNAVKPSVGGHPENIFFLTYDAFGVLPPISQLSKEQAMFHFISGYTSKVAGTEAGVTEPQTVFSACFGAPFLPLHPTKYAEMLGERIDKHNSKVWLVNTGLTGGPYGTGRRMSLPHTRALITAALNGSLKNVEFSEHPVFGVLMPESCEGVPNEVLNPREAWANSADYDLKANQLSIAFNDNFKQFADKASDEILKAAPRQVTVNA